MRIDISLPEDLVKRLRVASFEKYNNSRSMSRLIQEFVIKGLEDEPVKNEKKLLPGVEDRFKRDVEDMRRQLCELTLESGDGSRYRIHASGEEYFVLKEAFEQHLNSMADSINKCPNCGFVTGPVSKCDSAGKNFDKWLSMAYDKNFIIFDDRV
jgi:metal-responsive CopG/Arc/MetJ family transcriptional regulator